MSKHTSEPWYADGKLIVGAAPEYGQIGGCYNVADTDRIVACVNACADIEDPADLRKQRDDLLAVCKWLWNFVGTASDGGQCWVAIREQPGASKWAKDLSAAIAKAEEGTS